MSKINIESLVFVDYHIPTYKDVVAAGTKAAIDSVTKDIVKLLESDTILSNSDMHKILDLIREFEYEDRSLIVYKVIKKLEDRKEYDDLWLDRDFMYIKNELKLG